MNVILESSYSDDYINTYSVLKGIVLSLILFIIYLNGLLNLSLDAELYCYADDTVILLKHKNYDDLFKLANICLDKVKDLCDNNNLERNVNKSNYIIFNKNFNKIKNIFSDLYICIRTFNCKYLNHMCNCVPLIKVDSSKCRGVILNYRIKFKDHINIMIITGKENYFLNLKLFDLV